MVTRKPAKPDFIEVRWGQLGQTTQSRAFEPEITVDDFRDEVGIEDNIQIKRDGIVLEHDDEILDGDTLFLNPKRVTGGVL